MSADHLRELSTRLLAKRDQVRQKLSDSPRNTGRRGGLEEAASMARFMADELAAASLPASEAGSGATAAVLAGLVRGIDDWYGDPIALTDKLDGLREARRLLRSLGLYSGLKPAQKAATGARGAGGEMDETWIAEAEERERIKMSIPWNDQEMVEDELDALRSLSHVTGNQYVTRAVQEIERLRQQVGSLRLDRRDNYKLISELRAAAQPAPVSPAATGGDGCTEERWESLTPTDDGRIIVDCAVHGEIGHISTDDPLTIDRCGKGEGELIEQLWSHHTAQPAPQATDTAEVLRGLVEEMRAKAAHYRRHWHSEARYNTPAHDGVDACVALVEAALRRVEEI